MKKIVSSVFILVLLFLILWVISSWFLSVKNKDNFISQFDSSEVKPNHLFEYSLLNVSSSIFGINAKISVNLNDSHRIFSLIDDVNAKTYFNVDIRNGPIFIDKSGISFGSSDWKITLDEEANDENNLHIIKQLIKEKTFYINLEVGFDGALQYEIPLPLNSLKLFVKGKYDLKASINRGSVTSNGLNFKNKFYQIKTSNIMVKFKENIESGKNNETQRYISIKASVPELDIYKNNMTETVRLNIDYEGNISNRNELLNSESNINFKSVENLNYPLGNGIFKFKVTDLSLSKLISLVNDVDQIKNLEQQIQWILEEQAELPEGQDKIWQLQDRIKRNKVKLPQLVSKVLRTDKNNSVFKYSLVSNYQGNQSTLDGGVQLLSELSDMNNNSKVSLLSLAQLKAKVTLDDVLYGFMSSQLPIKEKEFILLYRQNKLLMH